MLKCEPKTILFHDFMEFISKCLIAIWGRRKGFDGGHYGLCGLRQHRHRRRPQIRSGRLVRYDQHHQTLVFLMFAVHIYIDFFVLDEKE